MCVNVALPGLLEDNDTFRREQLYTEGMDNLFRSIEQELRVLFHVVRRVRAGACCG
jgi:hypothetical protein